METITQPRPMSFSARPKTMRAVTYDRYGPPEVLRVEEIPVPEPKDGEVLVRVHASSVTRSDAHLRSASPLFARPLYAWAMKTGTLRRPYPGTVAGSEFAGEVAGVGAGVTEFAVGDRVFGVKRGANAEFLAVSAARCIAPMPANLSFEEAGGISDGALLTLSCLRQVELAGREVLIYGASGSMGTAGVQLAKHFGARVTAVCNTPNLDLARSLGADTVIDYLREDFTRNGKTYDVIFDGVGKKTFGQCRRSLKPGGSYLMTDGLPNVLWWVATSRRGDGARRARSDGMQPRYTKEAMTFLRGLVEAGEYRPVIDRRYLLEEVVEASRYVETGQKVGNVVLTVTAG